MHNKHGSMAGAVAEPDYQSPLWIYDTLMQEIEPELTSANIKRLDEPYIGETEDERKVRYERYDLAFVILDECIAELKADMEFDVLITKGMMDAIASGEEQTEKQEAVKGIEEAIEEEIDTSDFRA